MKLPLACLAASLASLLAAGAAAQTVRPGEERPELPQFEPEAAPGPALELPPAQLPEGAARERLSAGVRLFVREYRVVGGSVFSDRQIAEVTAPYSGREIDSEELLELRDALTRLYVDHGYVTSGAVIPDQDVGEGVIEIQLVEGTLAEIDVEGSRHLRPDYVRDRLFASARGPVNVQRLEQRLQLLQEDLRIDRVQAELYPGEVRGESFLRVEVEERSPYGLELEASNDRSPAVGSEGGRLRLAHRSLTGRGDVLEGWLDGSEGLDEWDARYALPINAYDTTLALHGRQSRADLIEDPVDRLDIESESSTYGVELRHPVWREPGRSLWLGLVGEIRESESFLGGNRFQFLPACKDGRCKLSVLRGVAEWIARGRTRVVALRSTLSFGLDAFDASENFMHEPSATTADGTFAAWLGQAQLAHRFSERWGRSLLIARADVQIAQDPLLPLEQYSVGGLHTVRGYRENEIVRDNALVASIELRVPVLHRRGRDVLEIAPFFDIGKGWNEPGVFEPSGPDTPDTLASLGLGLVASPIESLSLAVYWGGRLREVEHHSEHDLQDSGFSFEASFTLQ